MLTTEFQPLNLVLFIRIIILTLLTTRKDSYSETFYTMSHSKGFYFTNDHTDCKGEGCDWDVDVEKIVCEYLGVEKLKEIN